MTITVNTKAFNHDATVDANTNRYTGPAHTMSSNDLLQLRRNKSAASATSPGFAKAFAKFSRTVTVAGVQYEMIAEASFSVPVGATQAEVDSIRDDLGDFLVASNGADLVWKHDILQ